MKAYEKLLLIEQSQNDADFVLNEKNHISILARFLEYGLYNFHYMLVYSTYSIDLMDILHYTTSHITILFIISLKLF